ncbi:Transcriptional regulatory protein ZraR [Maioricimonas rarisocia]|uniref:Transcriptional regulatory protein ZraR n=2 Tax=Maioricimonas rarisocia TaxID=2528026 RepID=A0A517ZDY1_9PLAN|nr:Transcriptional regulatory protein ZraR [Maioricimonas rarisocia]
MTVARLSLRAGNDSWTGCVPTTLSHNPITMSNLSPPPATVRLTGRVAVLSTDPAACQKLAGVIVRLGFEAEAFHSSSELQAGLAREPFAACVIDEPETLTLVQQTESFARQNGRPTQFVVLPSLGSRTHLPSTPTTCEILDPPHTPDKLARALFAAVGRARLLAENFQLRRRLEGRVSDEIIGYSQATEHLRGEVRAVAEHSRPVLVSGETGSGTNIVARSIHAARSGAHAPLIRIRCGVLSSAAIEKELFGDGESEPRLATAAGGTLLLDDIDGISITLQQMLAELIQTGHYSPAGTTERRPLEARLIVTSHKDLKHLAATGQFDAELCELLCRDSIAVPPLRQRLDDIVPLAEHFLAEHAAREGTPVKRLTLSAVDRLKRHSWPGNVRELENVLRNCNALDEGSELSVDMLDTWVERPAGEDAEQSGMTLREMERKLIEATFNRYGGNRELTAKALKIGLRTLSGKLREYGYPPRGGPGSNRKNRAA